MVVATRSGFYWVSVKDAYPFHASAPLMEPTPHVYDTQIDEFVAVPFEEHGVTLWGFVSEEERDLFVKRYKNAMRIS